MALPDAGYPSGGISASDNTRRVADRLYAAPFAVAPAHFPIACRDPSNCVVTTQPHRDDKAVLFPT